MNNAIKKLCGALAFACGVGALGQAHAGGISDTGVNAYWGADDRNSGDVIGSSTYDIQGATITRAGSVLTIAIATSFAGHAGMDWLLNAGGVGYGDLFLANTWNALGSDSHHENDNAKTGTVWDYGLVLDDHFSNSGGSFTLYQLNGATNAANIKNAEAVSPCIWSFACTVRTGQESIVNTKSSTVANTGVTGAWTVDANKQLTFVIDLAGTELLNYTSFAMHWGETSQNDVIEGITSVGGAAVPLPGTAALLFLGLGALGIARRRKTA